MGVLAYTYISLINCHLIGPTHSHLAMLTQYLKITVVHLMSMHTVSHTTVIRVPKPSSLIKCDSQFAINSH